MNFEMRTMKTLMLEFSLFGGLFELLEKRRILFRKSQKLMGLSLNSQKSLILSWLSFQFLSFAFIFLRF